MSDWTELLPADVKSPVVLEARHPASWRQDRAKDSRVVAEIQALVDDPDYRKSLDGMLASIGADHFTLLAVEDEDPAARNGRVIVHLPPTVAEADQQRIASDVVEWMRSSRLGEVLWQAGRPHGLKEQVSFAGRRYARIQELGHIRRREDIRAHIQPLGKN